MVKTDDFRNLPFLEMAPHCITNLAGQLGYRVYFGKNGFSDGARDETSLGSLFNHKNEAPRSKLRGILRNSPKPLPSFAKASEGSPRLHPRSSLLRRSSHFGYEGRKLRGMRRRRISRSSSRNSPHSAPASTASNRLALLSGNSDSRRPWDLNLPCAAAAARRN